MNEPFLGVLFDPGFAISRAFDWRSVSRFNGRPSVEPTGLEEVDIFEGVCPRNLGFEGVFRASSAILAG
jgi:hypothetical protein